MVLTYSTGGKLAMIDGSKLLAPRERGWGKLAWMLLLFCVFEACLDVVQNPRVQMFPNDS